MPPPPLPAAPARNHTISNLKFKFEFQKIIRKPNNPNCHNLSKKSQNFSASPSRAWPPIIRSEYESYTDVRKMSNQQCAMRTSISEVDSSAAFFSWSSFAFSSLMRADSSLTWTRALWIQLQAAHSVNVANPKIEFSKSSAAWSFQVQLIYSTRCPRRRDEWWRVKSSSGKQNQILWQIRP